LNVLGGYEFYSSTGLQDRTSSGYGFNYNVAKGPYYDVPYYKAMQAMDQVNFTTNVDAPATTQLQSYFGRVQLGLFDKYFITGSLRDDGSNKLGANFKYGLFPAVGVRWDILKENFMAKNTIFSSLSIRVGYGQTGGTDALPNPGYQSSISSFSGYGVPADNTHPNSSPDMLTQNIGNANLK